MAHEPDQEADPQTNQPTDQPELSRVVGGRARELDALHGEFLACPLGGALIALGLWFLLREPCPVAGVDLGLAQFACDGGPGPGWDRAHSTPGRRQSHARGDVEEGHS